MRVATPTYDGNLMDIVCNPRYSTAMGLLFEASNQNKEANNSIEPVGSFIDFLSDPKVVLRRMKSWFLGNF